MTVEITGLDKVQAVFADIIKAISTPQAMRKLGRYVIKTIRERTRGQGKGVGRPGGNATKLKRVSDKYAKWRARQARHPEAASGTSSNLTFKGTMLDSLIIKNATKNSLFIGFRSQKQQDKADGQAEQGRRFMFLSGKEIKDAANYVKLNLRQS